MALPGSLPLAPRPFPDESIRSWIGRVAARYDLAPPELVARLRDGAEVDVSWLSSVDWREDAELDYLLARAARLDRARIRALRLVVANRPKPALWHRTLLAWCPACACEDVVRHGETYERAVWRLGCCAACPIHRLVLAEVCPVCTFGRVGFQAAAGRQRLVCTLCKRPVDASVDPGRGAGILHRRGQSEPGQCSDWIHPALALQTVLLGAAGGSASTDPWQLGIPANAIAVVVCDLAAALLWPAWQGWGSMPARDTTAVARDHAFTVLQPRIAYEVLSIIASVFTAVAGGSRLRTLNGQIEGLAPTGAAVELTWFIRRLPADEQRWLKSRAKGWGPILARAVGNTVDIEEADRRRAMVTREQARRDSAWVRHAAVQYANDARRRIAARAARRKAGALRRKQASSMANGPPR